MSRTNITGSRHLPKKRSPRDFSQALPLRLPGESEQDSRHAPSVPAGRVKAQPAFRTQSMALSSGGDRTEFSCQRCAR
jgi:hypothetical protein